MEQEVVSMEEIRRDLAGKIQRLKDTHNHPDEWDLTTARDRLIVTAFPKNLPPPGIKYSKNFGNFQTSGRFAIQVK